MVQVIKAGELVRENAGWRAMATCVRGACLD